MFFQRVPESPCQGLQTLIGLLDAINWGEIRWRSSCCGVLDLRGALSKECIIVI